MMTSLYHSLKSSARGVIFCACAMPGVCLGMWGVLQPVELLDRPRVAHVARVQGRGRLEQHDIDFLIRHRAMLDAPRHDDELPLRQLDGAIAEVHPKPSPDHVKQLVLVVVMVP